MWSSVQINIQNIKYETQKAKLIKCPKNSKFGSWCFWVSNKLLKEGLHTCAIKMIYKKDFNFKLIKGERERYISSDELEEMFDVMDNNIKPKSKVEIHKPVNLNEKEVIIDSDLKC